MFREPVAMSYKSSKSQNRRKLNKYFRSGMAANDEVVRQMHNLPKYIELWQPGNGIFKAQQKNLISSRKELFVNTPNKVDMVSSDNENRSLSKEIFRFMQKTIRLSRAHPG